VQEAEEKIYHDFLSLDVDSVNEKPLQNDLQHSFVAQVFYTLLQLQYMFKFLICPYVNPTCSVFITSLSLGFMQMLCKVSSSCFISSFGLGIGVCFTVTTQILAALDGSFEFK
jgi:hypothetical protein